MVGLKLTIHNDSVYHISWYMYNYKKKKPHKYSS